jgi:hypothetical protein
MAERIVGTLRLATRASTAGRCQRYPVLTGGSLGDTSPRVALGQPLGQCFGVLARQEVRHPVTIRPAVLRERPITGLHRQAFALGHRVGRRVDVRLVQINGIVDDGDDGEDVVVARNELRHGVHVARLRTAAPEEAVLEVRGRDLQRAANPLAGRKPGPRVRRVRRWMRTAVHEDRPIQRPHELNVVDADIARQRILLLENARPTEAPPLVRRRVWPALILQSSPDRLRRRVRSDAARLIERNSGVVAQRRLPEGVPLVVVQTPFLRNVGRGRLPARPAAIELGEHQLACSQRDGEEEPRGRGSVNLNHERPSPSESVF